MKKPLSLLTLFLAAQATTLGVNGQQELQGDAPKHPSQDDMLSQTRSEVAEAIKSGKQDKITELYVSFNIDFHALESMPEIQTEKETLEYLEKFLQTQIKELERTGKIEDLENLKSRFSKYDDEKMEEVLKFTKDVRFIKDGEAYLGDASKNPKILEHKDFLLLFGTMVGNGYHPKVLQSHLQKICDDKKSAKDNEQPATTTVVLGATTPSTNVRGGNQAGRRDL